MKTIILSIIFFITLSCNNDNDTATQNTTPFNAKVLYKGADCGNNFVIQFNSNAINVPTNTTDNIFYEVNLPNQYRVENLDINVTFRQTTDTETMSCTTQGIAYPQIYIESVN
jgi:hypothetical protein